MRRPRPTHSNSSAMSLRYSAGLCLAIRKRQRHVVERREMIQQAKLLEHHPYPATQQRQLAPIQRRDVLAE